MNGSSVPSSAFARNSLVSEDAFVDPYLIAGTDVLVNLVGAKTQSELMRAEPLLVTLASTRLRGERMAVEGTIAQLQEIHKALFRKVYPWAGEFRTVDISKGGSTFLPVAFLETGAQYVESVLHEDDMFRGMDRRTFIERLALITTISTTCILFVRATAVHGGSFGNWSPGTPAGISTGDW